jgi:hypothetical protein
MAVRTIEVVIRRLVAKLESPELSFQQMFRKIQTLLGKVIPLVPLLPVDKHSALPSLIHMSWLSLKPCWNSNLNAFVPLSRFVSPRFGDRSDMNDKKVSVADTIVHAARTADIDPGSGTANTSAAWKVGRLYRQQQLDKTERETLVPHFRVHSCIGLIGHPSRVFTTTNSRENESVDRWCPT